MKLELSLPPSEIEDGSGRAGGRGAAPLLHPPHHVQRTRAPRDVAGRSVVAVGRRSHRRDRLPAGDLCRVVGRADRQRQPGRSIRPDGCWSGSASGSRSTPSSSLRLATGGRTASSQQLRDAEISVVPQGSPAWPDEAALCVPGRMARIECRGRRKRGRRSPWRRFRTTSATPTSGVSGAVVEVSRISRAARHPSPRRAPNGHHENGTEGWP